MSAFTGSRLFLESVTQTGPSILRLKFAQDPLLSNPAGANDGLNKANYAVTGPAVISVIAVAVISGDPQSVNLSLSAPLISGSWRITATSIQTALGDPLVAPTFLDFVANPINYLPTIAQGAVSDTSESIIRKHVSSALVGRGWDALIVALATGDAYLSDLAAKAFRQLFKNTAGGKYLDKHASDEGLVRPAGVGISDDVFRKLIIKIGAEKLTTQSFLQVLETYYGPDALRASIDTANSELFVLADGDDLLLEVEGRLVTVVFKTEGFQLIGAAKANEVAAVITRALEVAGIQAYAVPILNPSIGLTIIRVYSGALGLRGALRVLGGRAQLALNFPTTIATTQVAATQWTVFVPATLPGLASNRARISWIGGTNPSLQLVRASDYISIYGTVFNTNNRGSFIIKDITTTYVEIENVNAVSQVGVSQIATNDVAFYRPTMFTLNSKPRLSVAAQGNTGNADVILPATTQAVGRSVGSGAYLHDNTEIDLYNKITVSSMSSNAATVTVNTATIHGLAINDTFFLAPGDPDSTKQFASGIKTVVGTPTTTSLTYTETGLAVSATMPQYLYPCYRDSNGLVTIKTSTANGFSSNDQIVMSGLIADKQVAPPFNTTLATSGFNNLWHLSWTASVQLSDGKVLQTGGDSAGVFKNFAVIYNPTTGTWAAGATMNVARSKHTATLLNNGRVLVTGGNASAPVATCEIYDPNTDVWIPVTSMANARYAHTATLLSDGRVLVFGGAAVATGEIFNPTTGLWTTTSAAPDYRYHHQAVRMQDNRVVLFGGYKAYPTPQAATWVYNPFNDYWITAAVLPTALFHQKALLTTQIGTSGAVIAIGGTSDDTVTFGDITVFNPQTLTWSAGPTMAQPRSRAAVVELTNGKILISGGMKDATLTHSLDDIIYYDPKTDTSGSLAAVYSGPNGRATHSAFQLANGKVLLGASDTRTRDNPELYDPQAGTYGSGGLNGTFPITVLDTKRFTYQTTADTFFAKTTPILTSYLNKEGIVALGKAKAEKAVIDNNHIGPYTLNATNGPAITGIGTTTAQDIIKGHNYSTFNVTSTSGFPDAEGYLVFAFGTDNQTFPVKYLNVINSTTLLLDTSFVFPVSLPSGTNLILLEKRGPLELASPETTGLFYLTDSVAGRIAASRTIDSISAAGATINKTITYPGDVGLGNEGLPVTGKKISDKVMVWGVESEVNDAHEE